MLLQREKFRVREDRGLSRRQAEPVEANGKTSRHCPVVRGGREPKTSEALPTAGPEREGPNAGWAGGRRRKSCRTPGSLPGLLRHGFRKRMRQVKVWQETRRDAGGQEGDIFIPTLRGQQGQQSTRA